MLLEVCKVCGTEGIKDVPMYNIFHKEFHAGLQVACLIYCPEFLKMDIGG